MITPEDAMKDALECGAELDSIRKNIDKYNASDFLKESEVKIEDNIQKPPICLSIIENGNESVLGTLGNFSLVIGKAKSRKSFFISIALAACLKNGIVLDKLKGNLAGNNNEILYFDTEQGKYHVYQALNRVCRLSNIFKPTKLKVYGLRKYTPEERMLLIESAIYSTDNLGFVVIDGIRDLINSINDEGQATMIATKLLKWTEERNIHILCVLHMNKGDSNARGHLGTDLQNKAESVLSIKKDDKQKEYSIVEEEYCRDKDFKPFAFSINADNLPYMAADYKSASDSNKSKVITPAGIVDTTHKALLKELFGECPYPTYKELYLQIKLRFDVKGVHFGESKAKEFVAWYLMCKYITAPTVKGTKKSFYTVGEALV